MGTNISIGNYISRGRLKTHPYKLIQDYSFDKSNNDVDRDKVYNKMNPNQFISLYNFGYSLNSGYGLYSNNFNDWTVQFGSTNTKNSSFVEVDNINGTTKSGTWLNIRNVPEGTICTHPSFKVRISGANGSTFKFIYLVNGVKTSITVGDGIFEVPESTGTFPDYAGSNKVTLYSFKFPHDKKIKVEEVPEYPNHLVFDGVDDYTSYIPNFNPDEGTVLVQYHPIDRDAVKMISNTANGSVYSYTFFIGNVSIQSRGFDTNTRVEIPFNMENTISAFAYDSVGINIFSNGTFKTSNNVNNKYQYSFGKDWNSNKYGKIALKRVKVFNKKLTEKQIREEYNKLLKE